MLPVTLGPDILAADDNEVNPPADVATDPRIPDTCSEIWTPTPSGLPVVVVVVVPVAAEVAAAAADTWPKNATFMAALAPSKRATPVMAEKSVHSVPVKTEAIQACSASHVAMQAVKSG